jgi:hypothetical protein
LSDSYIISHEGTRRDTNKGGENGKTLQQGDHNSHNFLIFFQIFLQGNQNIAYFKQMCLIFVFKNLPQI